MSKPSSLEDILDDFGHAVANNLNVENSRTLLKVTAEKQIRELAQSILLEYKDKHLGREGIKILNELHERMGRL